MPRPSRDGDYTRRTMCFAFAQGQCNRQACSFSHTLIDPTRLLQLVGDVPRRQAAPSSTDPTYLSLEFRAIDGGSGPDFCEWEVRLCNGGRITVNGDRWNINVQPVYPKAAKARSLLEAVKQLEIQVLGRVAPVRPFTVESSLTSEELVITGIMETRRSYRHHLQTFC